MIPTRRPQPWFEPPTDSPADPRRTVESEVDELVVRPFIVTSGRTRPLRDDLRIETLVQAQPAALSAPLRFEERAIVRLCQQPQSIAEIASALGVPIGVARVVIGDLATARHVSITESGELPLATIERMRDLVRAL
ncbi:MAG: DUF742 domain-containing protein [Umezawaea sp.]